MPSNYSKQLTDLVTLMLAFDEKRSFILILNGKNFLRNKPLKKTTNSGKYSTNEIYTRSNQDFSWEAATKFGQEKSTLVGQKGRKSIEAKENWRSSSWRFDECIEESSSKLSDGYISCGHGAFCSNNIGGYACLCRHVWDSTSSEPNWFLALLKGKFTKLTCIEVQPDVKIIQ